MLLTEKSQRKHQWSGIKTSISDNLTFWEFLITMRKYVNIVLCIQIYFLDNKWYILPVIMNWHYKIYKFLNTLLLSHIHDNQQSLLGGSCIFFLLVDARVQIKIRIWNAGFFKILIIFYFNWYQVLWISSYIKLWLT